MGDVAASGGYYVACNADAIFADEATITASIGVVGKFFLFSVASRAGFHWLVAVAAVNSTISLYY